MRRLILLAVGAALVVGIGPAASGADENPYCQRDLAANSSVLNVEYLCRIPTTRHSWDANGNLITDPASPTGYRETQTQAISLNFIDYGNPRADQPDGAATKDVLFVSGRFGLKAFDITRPTAPKLLDWLGDGVDDPILPNGSRSRTGSACSTTCGRTRTWTSIPAASSCSSRATRAPTAGTRTRASRAST